jgi:hypothetical protein
MEFSFAFLYPNFYEQANPFTRPTITLVSDSWFFTQDLKPFKELNSEITQKPPDIFCKALACEKTFSFFTYGLNTHHYSFLNHQYNYFFTLPIYSPYQTQIYIPNFSSFFQRGGPFHRYFRYPHPKGIMAYNHYNLHKPIIDFYENLYIFLKTTYIENRSFISDLIIILKTMFGEYLSEQIKTNPCRLFELRKFTLYYFNLVHAQKNFLEKLGIGFTYTFPEPFFNTRLVLDTSLIEDPLTFPQDELFFLKNLIFYHPSKIELNKEYSLHGFPQKVKFINKKALENLQKPLIPLQNIRSYAAAPVLERRNTGLANLGQPPRASRIKQTLIQTELNILQNVEKQSLNFNTPTEPTLAKNQTFTKINLHNTFTNDTKSITQQIQAFFIAETKKINSSLTELKNITSFNLTQANIKICAIANKTNAIIRVINKLTKAQPLSTFNQDIENLKQQTSKLQANLTNLIFFQSYTFKKDFTYKLNNLNSTQAQLFIHAQELTHAVATLDKKFGTAQTLFFEKVRDLTTTISNRTQEFKKNLRIEKQYTNKLFLHTQKQKQKNTRSFLKKIKNLTLFNLELKLTLKKLQQAFFTFQKAQKQQEQANIGATFWETITGFFHAVKNFFRNMFNNFWEATVGFFDIVKKGILALRLIFLLTVWIFLRIALLRK